MTDNTPYLAAGLPVPVPENDQLSAPYWNGLRENRLLVQRCDSCGTWQWGPEWICHKCHSFELSWQQVKPEGRIYSWQRSWHPVHPALVNNVPYLTVLVALPDAGDIRMIGNLLGDPQQTVVIDTPVQGVFEHHPDYDPPFSLLQWHITTDNS